jgi:pyruvate dehydrogenase E2 component (dihydrolipoamide acetyltransferase)
MSSLDIKVPDIGGIADVEIIELLIKAGDTIELEQSLAVMESDKASMDLPAPLAGIVQTVHVKVGDKVSEGSLIATLAAAGEVLAPVVSTKTVVETPTVTAAPTIETSPPMVETAPVAQEISTPVEHQAITTNDDYIAHASPSIRRYARELGIDINTIKVGSGRKGRITKDDVKAHVKKIITTPQTPIQAAPIVNSGSGIQPIPAVDFSKFGDIEEMPLSKIKRLTGQHLSRVWLNLPMVTYHDEVDITDMEAFRVAMNGEKGADVKLTGLLFIMKALVAALQKFPTFNSALSPNGESLILKKFFHIGIAVDTPNGLVVPVIRDVDKKGLHELAIELGELSAKARKGELKPAEMQGGCMTISSLGGIGGTAFTPIVNAPEVVILGVTRSAMKPVWNGTEFIPRLMLPLDLTYDHRVIDGAEGARFMATVCAYLNDVRRLLL